MSPRARRMHSCTSKKPYKTRGEAWDRAKQLGKGIEVYTCHYCYKFHIGHSTSDPTLRCKRRKRTSRFVGKKRRYT